MHDTDKCDCRQGAQTLMYTGQPISLLDLRDMNPVILFCSYFSSRSFLKGTPLGPRYVFDYEIEYITEGDGTGHINTDGRAFSVSRGDILVRKPGSKVVGYMPYSTYCICFDPSGKSRIRREEYWDMGSRRFLQNFTNEIMDALPPIYRSSDEMLLPFFKSVYNEFINPGPISAIVQKTDMLGILGRIYMEIKTEASPKQLHPSAYHSKLKKVIEHIGMNYDKPLSLGSLADIAELSPNYFHTVFTRATGKTPNGFVSEIRMDKARELILNTALKIAVIADKCGFASASYFSSVFYWKYGMSPSRFRAIMKQSD